jgi:SOS-response transcriptional repressor LexA
MARIQRSLVGRPRKGTERKSERIPIYVTPSTQREIAEQAALEGKELAEFGRDAIEFYIAHRHLAATGGADRSYRARLLTKAPCGPWQEAIEHASYLTLSEEIADELEVREGDVLVRAEGESMESAGILDGALVLMRPLDGGRQPRRGEIALVQVTTSDGDCQGTIKHWHPGDVPTLKDGDGNLFPLPEDTAEVRAIAVARGVVSRL